MNHDEFDRILSEEQGIVPSSGFATAVMDAVRREASAPPPIPFPWKRALPGLAAAGLGLASVFVCFVRLVRGAAGMPGPATQSSELVPILQTMMDVRAGWIALVLLLTLASVTLSMRLAVGRS
jgi:hypothetical protein